MFDRQFALMKGQGYNIVQSLSHEDEGGCGVARSRSFDLIWRTGPLELCQRRKVLVYDDRKEVPNDEATRDRISATASPSDYASETLFSDAPRTPDRPHAASKTASETTPLLAHDAKDSFSPQRPASSSPKANYAAVARRNDLFRHSRIDGMSGFSMLEQIEALIHRGYDEQETLISPPRPRRAASSYSESPTHSRARSGSLGKNDRIRPGHTRWASHGARAHQRSSPERESLTKTVIIEVRDRPSKCD